MMTTVPRNSPAVDLVLIAIGVILFLFRDALGSMTGYFARGHYIDEPTPGCLLIPVAPVSLAAHCFWSDT